MSQPNTHAAQSAEPRPPVPPPQPAPPPHSVISPVPLGPPPPTLFQRHWPACSAEAGPRVLVAAAVAGLAAAASVPLERTGLGWLVTGVVVFLALLFAARGAPGIHPEAAGWGLAAVALLCVGFVRSAGWLFVLCVLAALGCFALALTRGRTPTGTVLALLAMPVAAMRGLPWASRGLDRLRRASGSTNAIRLVASTAIGLVLVLVFGALFASADPAFGKIVDYVVPDFSGATPLRWAFLFGTVGLATLGGAYLLANPSTLGEVTMRTPKPVRRLEWALPLGALLALFALFVGVQLTVLFGGRDYVMRTVDLTYAEYARRGFWQLLVVTVLTLAVMAVTARKAPRVEPADRLVLRVLLGALTLCSLVIVASALSRMSVYEQAYGYTRLRVFVSAVELWLGALFVLVLVAGVRLRGDWLPRAALASWVLTLFALAALNPDRFIAAQNIARYERTDRIDVSYLRTLSPDAVPELDRLGGQARACALGEIVEHLKRYPDDWRGLNLARVQARTIVARGEPVDRYCVRGTR